MSCRVEQSFRLRSRGTLCFCWVSLNCGDHCVCDVCHIPAVQTEHKVPRLRRKFAWLTPASLGMTERGSLRGTQGPSTAKHRSLSERCFSGRDDRVRVILTAARSR